MPSDIVIRAANGFKLLLPELRATAGIQRQQIAICARFGSDKDCFPRNRWRKIGTQYRNLPTLCTIAQAEYVELFITFDKE